MAITTNYEAPFPYNSGTGPMTDLGSIFITGATQIIAGNGLTGGGDLTTDRTINVVGGACIAVDANSVKHSAPAAGAAATKTALANETLSSLSFDEFGHTTSATWAQRNLDSWGTTISALTSTGTITAPTFAGNATSATSATNFNVLEDNATNANHYVIFTGGASGNQRPNSDNSLTYNPSTNLLSVFNIQATTSSSNYLDLQDEYITLRSTSTSVDADLRITNTNGLGLKLQTYAEVNGDGDDLDPVSIISCSQEELVIRGSSSAEISFWDNDLRMINNSYDHFNSIPTKHNIEDHSGRFFNASSNNDLLRSGNVGADTNLTLGVTQVSCVRVGNVASLSGHIEVGDFTQSVPSSVSIGVNLDINALAVREGWFRTMSGSSWGTAVMNKIIDTGGPSYPASYPVAMSCVGDANDLSLTTNGIDHPSSASMITMSISFSINVEVED